MTEREIKILLDFQHFSKNERLENVIKKTHVNFTEKDETAYSVMSDSETEQLAAAGVEGTKRPKDRKTFIKSLGGLLILLCLSSFISCQQDTETVYIDQTEIKTTLYTNAKASKVSYYIQRYFTDENGDKFIDEKAESYEYLESEDKTVAAGTKISEIGKEIEGFEQHGFSQSGSTLYLFYRAKTVTYKFFLSNDDTVPITTLIGKSQLPLTSPPTKNYSNSGKFARWATADGEELQKTYGTRDQNYYAQWFTPLGTKEKPDSIGDIVFSDGTAISCEGSVLSEEQKKNAIAVIVSTTYNRTTGHGTGYNEGKTILGLGTLSYEGEWAKEGEWPEDEDKNYRVTSQNDGRLSMAIIKEWYSLISIVNWINKYPKSLEEKGIILYGDLSSGWYLPAYFEWQQAVITGSLIKKAFEAIDFPIDIIENANDFWTSSYVKAVVGSSSKASWVIRTAKNNLDKPDSSLKALAMREFK